MSHTVKIDVVYKNKDILLDSLTKFGWEIKTNSKIRCYDDDDTVFDYVAINPIGDYDIGLKVQEDGTIEVKSDFWDDSIERQLGTKLGLLTQEYAKNLIESEFTYQGYAVDVEVLNDGALKLIVSR